jgi:predicted metalloprotease with PDZ domain
VRIWSPARASEGPVTVHYRAKVSQEMMAGPSWELRAEPRGFSMAGNTVLLLPDDATPYRVKLNWDLSALPAGARTLDSLPADSETAPVTADTLRETYYMAGNLFMSPLGHAFRAASTADTPYDQMELLNWSAKAYDKMYAFFGPPQRPTFTVMFRGSKISRISGTELPGALQATMMADTPIDKVELLASHEMVHVFMGGLDPQSWFEEGLAVFYQNRAPFMTGLIDEDAYIADVNETARTYYRNVRFDMPMKEAEQSFWTDARARLQPYVRGGLYFSLVNAKLKAATHGKRNLDSVMREFIADRNAGKSVTVADWLKLIARDLGPAAEADYQAMMDGKKLFLPADAFGPCFKQAKERVPVFELGFDTISLMKSPRIIQHLDPNSPAAKAGLKEGDKVVWSTSQDTAQEEYRHDMVLKVEREGKTVEIRFLPHGALTDGYQWKRVAKGTQCRV